MWAHFDASDLRPSKGLQMLLRWAAQNSVTWTLSFIPSPHTHARGADFVPAPCYTCCRVRDGKGRPRALETLSKEKRDRKINKSDRVLWMLGQKPARVPRSTKEAVGEEVGKTSWKGAGSEMTRERGQGGTVRGSGAAKCEKVHGMGKGPTWKWGARVLLLNCPKPLRSLPIL